MDPRGALGPGRLGEPAGGPDPVTTANVSGLTVSARLGIGCGP